MIDNFLGHAPCPVCNSEDNLSVSETTDENTGELLGHSIYCNTPNCTNRHDPRSLERSTGSRWYDLDKLTDQSYTARRNNPMNLNDAKLELPPLKKHATQKVRNISPEVLNKYGVYLATDGRLVFPMANANQEIVGAKTLSYDAENQKWSKQWRWVEGSDTKNAIFGAKTTNFKSRIIITEGEWDAMSVRQMTGYNAVSIPNGAGCLTKFYKQNIRWVESFDEVFILMDNDEAGRHATDELRNSGAIDQLKVNFVSFPTMYGETAIKDPNDLLPLGGVRDTGSFFKESLFASKQAVPEEFYTPDNMLENSLSKWFNDDPDDSLSTGIPALDDCLGGWRKGELTTILAGTGIGKSSFTRSIVASLFNRNQKVMIYSLEENPTTTFNKILYLLYGSKLHGCSREEFKAYAKPLADSLVLVKSNGQTTPEKVKKEIDYAVRGQGVKYVLMDNLTRAIDQSNAMDSTNNMVSTLVDCVNKHNIHVFLVSHTKRSESGNNATPDISQGRNSGIIESFSHNILALGRKEGEDVLTVAVKKNREFGELGQASLHWSNTTKRFDNMTYYDEVNNGTQRTSDEQVSDDGGELPTTVSRADSSQGEDSEKVQQPGGGVPTERRSRDGVRQPSRGEASTSDVRPEPPVRAGDSTDARTNFNNEKVPALPRLSTEDDKGNTVPGSEGATDLSSTPENQGNRPRNLERTQGYVCSKASGTGGRDASTQWYLSPQYRPQIKR